MRLHIVVVRFDRVDDGFGLVILPGDVDTDGDVAPFHLVVDGLADVMQKSGALGRDHIDAQFRGQQARDVGHFDRVVQHVLAVAGAVAHPAQQTDELGMQAVDVGLKHGAFAFGLDGGVDFLLRLGDHLFDAGGVNAAVLNELLQRETGNFPPHRVKAGDGDGLGRVVDDQIAAGQGFDAADVASFAADDAALHFVVGEGDDGNGDFTGVVRGTALNGRRDDLTGAVVGLFLVLGLDFLDLHGHLMRDVVLDVFNQIGFGFVYGETGDLFQHL